jgi:septal ring-binding cell division protein DamX
VAQVQDEGFHEIQLNGKQLVFLFMAATVVSVVIFLCGVLVGRGVRAERGLVADAASAASSAETAPPAPAATAAPAPTPAGSDPTKAAPPPPADDLTYFNRLEKPSPASEKLKAAPEKAVPPVVKSAPPAPAPAPAPAQKTVPAPAEMHAESQATAEPSGSGFAVQIAALNVRSEADAIAKRLSSKGYAAYVLSPASGTPTVFRVRVGKFPTRREAETVASKLQKEEQFKPWVTR